jgi:nucleoside-diphosphate-sugar epimerase
LSDSEGVGTRVLVTGATGFIGTTLLGKLVRAGYQVRALTRRGPGTAPPGFAAGFAAGLAGGGSSNLRGSLGSHGSRVSDSANGSERVDGRGLSGGAATSGRAVHDTVSGSVEWVAGDILDAGSVRAAMRGCRQVFHLAAYAKNWAPRLATFDEYNVGGLRNVLEAAREADVERIVWTSTMVVFGPTARGEIADESRPRPAVDCFTEYEASKVRAEAEASAAIAAGAPLVVVNPSRVYGPGHLTEGNSMARLIDDYDRGRFPILLNAGVNVANYGFVDDIAEGHLLAMRHGRIGERYLLGGENVSLKQLFRLIDELTGRRHWKIPIFRPGALLFAYGQRKRAEWLGVYPTITPGWVRTFLVDWSFSCAKAERELGYRPTPFRDGLARTLEWLASLRELKNRR